jgi:hypothetical protein
LLRRHAWWRRVWLRHEQHWACEPPAGQHRHCQARQVQVLLLLLLLLVVVCMLLLL